MNLEDRITYDSETLLQMLENAMNRLRPFHYDKRYKELLGETLINKLTAWDDTISRQKDTPLTLVVCGEFKRGKSSLINAILGEDVVTTNVTTETITTNKISFGSHSNALVMRGGKRIKLTDEELQCDRLKEILQSAPDATAALELKRPLEILKQLTIIDTPGLGDAMQDFSADVAEALRQADAVIYVFSALYPLSMQEQMFIRSVIKPQRYTDLFLAANFCDVAETPDDCQRLEQVIRDRIEDILPGEEPIMLSALDERCRQLGSERPCKELEDYLSGNFEAFRAQLTELLESKQEMIIPDRMQRLIRGMQEDLRADLNAMYEGLSASEQTIFEKMQERKGYKAAQEKEQKKILDTVEEKIGAYKAQCMQWFTQLIRAMEADAKTLSGVSADDLKRYYPMFCVDTLQDALDRCMKNFLRIVYEEMDNVSADISKNISFSGISSAHFRFSLNNKTWTNGDNVAFAGDVADTRLGLGSLLSMGTTLLGGVMRRNEVKEKKVDLVKEICEQYPTLLNTALIAVGNGFDSFTGKAKEQLSEYFSERMQAFDQQIEQAEMVAKQDESKKETIRAALDEISMTLKKIEEELSVEGIERDLS